MKYITLCAKHAFHECTQQCKIKHKCVAMLPWLCIASRTVVITLIAEAAVYKCNNRVAMASTSVYQHIGPHCNLQWLASFTRPTHTHTHTRTHIHTRTHNYTHAYTYTYTHTQNTHTHACPFSQIPQREEVAPGRSRLSKSTLASPALLQSTTMQPPNPPQTVAPYSSRSCRSCSSSGGSASKACSSNTSSHNMSSHNSRSSCPLHTIAGAATRAFRYRRSVTAVVPRPLTSTTVGHRHSHGAGRAAKAAAGRGHAAQGTVLDQPPTAAAPLPAPQVPVLKLEASRTQVCKAAVPLPAQAASSAPGPAATAAGLAVKGGLLTAVLEAEVVTVKVTVTAWRVCTACTAHAVPAPFALPSPHLPWKPAAPSARCTSCCSTSRGGR